MHLDFPTKSLEKQLFTPHNIFVIAQNFIKRFPTRIFELIIKKEIFTANDS